MILGHQRQIQYLERVLKKGAMAHAYLFSGPEAVGKKTAALALARSLLCRNNHEVGLGGCGQCGDCRQAEIMAHPDLIFLSLESLLVEEDNKREIGIKNIHELRRILGLSAWSGGWRIAVVDGAEHLSREAQSALLKTLEEPSSRTLIILITAAPELLLPTIRSRCVSVGFTTLADAELKPLLEGAPASRRSSLLELADGRPGELQRLLSERRLADTIGEDRERFRKLLGAGLGQQFAFSDAEAREPGRLEIFLEFLIWERRKMLQLAMARPSFGEQNLGGPALFLKTLLEKLAISRTTPVNRRLLADSVFFELNMLEAK